MSEQNQPIDICDDIEVVGPGQMLREAREAKGLSQQDVATHLNFRLALVNELETEAFDASTPSTFLRGYLRNYAKFLGIDDKDILASYETLGVARQQRDEMKSFSRSTAKKAENKLLMVTSSVLATLMIGFSAYHFILEDNSESVTIASTAETVDTATLSEAFADDANNVIESTELVSDSGANAAGTQSTINVAAVAPGEQGANQLLNSETQEREIATVEPDESQSSVPEVHLAGVVSEVQNRTQSTNSNTNQNAVTTQVPAQQTDATNLVVAEAELNFVFTGDCWVNIFDADGNRLAWGIKKNDYVMTLTGKPPFSVTLGKPELVQMTYQGEEISLAEFKVGQIAKLTVPEPVDEEAAE
ncbi:DUF4115 domain-containing protein [Thalassotalea litorea]|uniref:DUF4115 domain-containing protein n=1 Tax=Thalassotalea litorea TaxID=2020715 RepID=A0A5R9IMK7_9GAMM|nr:RodZ domain-containing protein [Thalassotalea litorea]TLU66765.1 DUF4115 domain-containing protein [Thalassotalea litorea]